jgi:uncharacterized protein YvpB
LAGAVLLFVIVVMGLKTMSPVRLDIPKASVALNGPVSVRLNQLFSMIDTNRIQILPAVEGSWQHAKGSIVGSDRLVFTPSKYFIEDTTYKVDLPNASRLIGGATTLPDFQFTTEKAPSLSSTAGIGAWSDGKIIAADTEFTAELVSPNNGTRELELRTTPAISLTSEIVNDRTYTWKPGDLLPQGSEITLDVFDTKNNESVLKKAVRVASEPALTSPLHRNNVDEKDTIALTFNEPISQDSADIKFDLGGAGVWQNENTYVFTPEKLIPNSTYNYTVAKNLRSKAGGILTTDIGGSFTTVGPLTVVATSPSGYELSQGQQTISFTFNRPVDQTSALQRLSVSSGTITGTYWKGYTLYATVANLGFQQSFSATVAAGVVNTSFGLPSSRSYSLSFTTEARTARLNVPFYRQQYNASCTAASLRMILGWRGISADDMSIVQRMGYSPRPRDNSTNPPTWDDPQTMFVGDINGTIQAGTGAGPDAPPIVKAAQTYGLSASAVTGIGANWIAEQLHTGRPVIMFGATRASGMTSWQIPGGGTATMNLTGHTTVVIGVKGEPSAPLGFWVSDPLGGTSYWSTAMVESNISRDPYRQAVVAY